MNATMIGSGDDGMKKIAIQAAATGRKNGDVRDDEIAQQQEEEEARNMSKKGGAGRAGGGGESTDQSPRTPQMKAIAHPLRQHPCRRYRTMLTTIDTTN